MYRSNAKKLASRSKFIIPVCWQPNKKANCMKHLDLIHIDIDECATANGGCDQICVNKPGSFECKCNAGYLLADDKKTCNG